jgi:membrane protease YdiL (CAAX protease family)
VAEETLFRGPIHALLGLWPTALLFGLSHGGLRPGMRVWAAFAVLAGVLLGLLADVSGSIWPGVLAHLLVNAVNMHRLRRYLRPAWA